MKIAVFRSGTHTDMNGTTREFTDDDLDKIAGSYDPEKHTAPVVIGHPKNDSPAWGWVESLSRQGDLLIAKLRDIAPEFTSWVQDGRYKKRSISLYPDLTLKHLGFLGAVPPAVKGLPDAGFSDDTGSFTIEFNERNKIMELKDFFEGLKFWEAAKAQAAPTEKKEDKPAASFSEADLEAAKRKAAEDAAKAERDKLTAEFAEKERVAGLKTRTDAMKSEVDQMSAAGKIPPAWIKAGIVEFMLGLDSATEIQFSEGADKQSPLGWFRKFLADLPAVVEFKEFATRDTAQNMDAGAKIQALVQKKMTDNAAMSYSEALAAVQLENTALVMEYLSN